jgi:hypothetical protein
VKTFRDPALLLETHSATGSIEKRSNPRDQPIIGMIKGTIGFVISRRTHTPKVSFRLGVGKCFNGSGILQSNAVRLLNCFPILHVEQAERWDHQLDGMVSSVVVCISSRGFGSGSSIRGCAVSIASFKKRKA